MVYHIAFAVVLSRSIWLGTAVRVDVAEMHVLGEAVDQPRVEIDKDFSNKLGQNRTRGCVLVMEHVLSSEDNLLVVLKFLAEKAGPYLIHQTSSSEYTKEQRSASKWLQHAANNLADASETLISFLEIVAADPDQFLQAMGKAMVEELAPGYDEWCLEFKRNYAHLLNLVKEHPAIGSGILELQKRETALLEKQRGAQFASFLIQPMQRYAKYPLLMKDLKKHCSLNEAAANQALSEIQAWMHKLQSTQLTGELVELAGQFATDMKMIAAISEEVLSQPVVVKESYMGTTMNSKPVNLMLTSKHLFIWHSARATHDALRRDKLTVSKSSTTAFQVKDGQQVGNTYKITASAYEAEDWFNTLR